MDRKRKKISLSAAQMKKMIPRIEAGLKKAGRKLTGGGAVDYASPRVLELYMRKHPMSKVEFYVDHGGVVTGAGKKKSKKISFRALAAQVGRAMKREAKAAGNRMIKKGVKAAEHSVENMAKKAAANVAKVTKSALTGSGLEGGHYFNKEGKVKGARDLNSNHYHKTKRASMKAVKKPPQTGSGHCGAGYGSMHGDGMRQMEGAGKMHGGRHMQASDPSIVAPKQRDDGGSAAESLGGLNYMGQAFVAAPVMGASPGNTVVPYNNHLRNMQFAPAGGYGGMGFLM
jgi:hypothetical protein